MIYNKFLNFTNFLITLVLINIVFIQGNKIIHKMKQDVDLDKKYYQLSHKYLSEYKTDFGKKYYCLYNLGLFQYRTNFDENKVWEICIPFKKVYKIKENDKVDLIGRMYLNLEKFLNEIIQRIKKEYQNLIYFETDEYKKNFKQKKLENEYKKFKDLLKKVKHIENKILNEKYFKENEKFLEKFYYDTLNKISESYNLIKINKEKDIKKLIKNI